MTKAPAGLPQDETTGRKLPGQADPSVDFTTAAERPGNLRSEASLVVQTRQAQRLVYGRHDQEGKHDIIGLVRFGNIMRRIWTCAQLDDPYADWFLVRVLEALEDAREEVEVLTQRTGNLLQSFQGIEIEVARSTRPVRVPLQFATPYGYMGAYLVADYDALVRSLLTARHVGLVTRQVSEQSLHHGARLVRRSFVLPAQWKYMGLTRDDLRQDNQRAQLAIQTMGEVPEEILNGAVRARYAPEIRTATSLAATNSAPGSYFGFASAKQGDDASKATEGKREE